MKTATARLVVALFSLLAAVLELGTALLRLVTALALRAASAVRPRSRAPLAPPQGRPRPAAARIPQPARLRVVPPPVSSDLERGRLVVALTGMGFKMPAVRRFVDGLGDRIGREPIETLIKEGLASLAA